MSSLRARQRQQLETDADRAIDKLYRIAWRDGTVDANRVAQLISTPGVHDTEDARMELLLRDALRGLQAFWGDGVLRAKLRWFGADADLIDRLRYPANDSRGFRSMRERTMNATDPDAVLAMFRDLGCRVRQPATLVVGGSISLILEGLIVHATHDIHVVDELPSVIREDHALLHELADRHRLDLTHFQSHYLPDGWARRVKSLGVFGKVTVRLVDPIDMLVCKLFSRRPNVSGTSTRHGDRSTGRRSGIGWDGRRVVTEASRTLWNRAATTGTSSPARTTCRRWSKMRRPDRAAALPSRPSSAAPTGPG